MEKARQALSRTCVIALILLVAGVVFPLAAHATQFTVVESRITTNLADQFDNSISGGRIVYTDLRGADADTWYYDLATQRETQVVGRTGHQQLNDISGDWIVYTDYVGYDVYAYRISTGTETNLTAAANSVSLDPAVGGNLVAWQDNRDGNREIYARDMITGEERRISNSPAVDEKPAVADGKIVWQRAILALTDIYCYDWTTGATSQITNTPTDEERSPDISGNRIVYSGLRNGERDIYCYDLVTGVETTLSLPGDQSNPNISGDWVAFDDTSLGTYHVRLWHIPTGEVFELTTAKPGAQYLNDIEATGPNTGRVAYSDDRNGNIDIYMSEFTATFDTTPPETTCDLDPAGPDGNAGWYVTTPQVTLTASEEGTTYYQWDGTADGEWTTMADTPIVFPAIEGSHTLNYYSKDLAGNQETVQSRQIKVDTQAPGTGQYFDPAQQVEEQPDGSEMYHITSQVLIGLNPEDFVSIGIPPGLPFPPGSGVAKTEYKIGNGPWQLYTAPFTLPPENGFIVSFSWRSTDVAGNEEYERTQPVLLNDRPAAQDANVTTDEDQALTIAMPATAGGNLTYEAVTQPAHGTLGPVVGNTVLYTPAENYNGTDSFKFKANDGTIDTNEATVSITINPVNDAPVLEVVGDQTLDEGTSVSIPISASDIDGDALTLSGSNLPSFARVADRDEGDGTGYLGYLVLAPDFDDAGTYADATILVTDSGGLTDYKKLTITVRNVNRAPVANDWNVPINEDMPLVIPLAASDPDTEEMGALAYSITVGPTYGTLTGTGSMVTYTPNLNFHGTDSITFKATDPGGLSDTAVISITVNPTNDSAVATDDTPVTSEDVAVAVRVLDNDSDPDGDTLSVASVTQPTHGTAAVNTADNTVVYTPAADYNGSDTFTYTTSDGNGSSATATVRVTVNPADDAPRNVSAGPDQTVDERAGVTLTGTAINVDGDGLSYTWAQTGGPLVSLSAPNSANTAFTAPDVYENTTLTFRLTVSDGITPVADNVVITVRNVAGATQWAKGAQGYWKNHPEHIAQILAGGSFDLGDTVVTTVPQAVAILSDATAKDARTSLRAHLLATILNLRNGSDPMALGYDIRPVVTQAKNFLATHTSPILQGSPDRAACIALKDKLEAYNNSGQ